MPSCMSLVVYIFPHRSLGRSAAALRRTSNPTRRPHGDPPMTDNTDSADAPTRRSGISFFGPPAEAPGLHETDMMSMPEVDPQATEQFMEWAMSGGHIVKVLYREGDMSLVWSWF